jgi:transposase InsO family protein
VFDAYVINTDAPLIIGKLTIKKFNLHVKMYRQWWRGFRPQIEEASLTRVLSITSSEVSRSKSVTEHVDDIPASNSDVLLTSADIFTLDIDKEDDFLLHDHSNELEFNTQADLSTIPDDIQGTESFRVDLISVCREFQDIFSRVVRDTPADIPPMVIDVDDVKWFAAKTHKSPRPTSVSQQMEIKRQIEKMLELKVIGPSSATQVSQVLLVPKPDDKWRFCVDFRLLNSCSGMSSWPLPNIEQTLNRIGHSKPCYFGILDLTSGYHQAPLAPQSQKFTAFICFMGVYEWLRVAMGLKGAPSYFQQQLASIVLVGLLYITCELYLDDVIIFASTEEEFLVRLRKVFERFRQYRITVNPDKVTLGVHEIEYVGHLLSQNGHYFSREKIDSLVNFHRPVTAHDLKSFLGLANYFRNHVRNMSLLCRPLQRMINNYSKKQASLCLTWNDVTNKAFQSVVDAIRSCPRLSFIDDHSPIFVETDACMYGFGGYIYQLVDDREVPIKFISSVFSGSQLNWSIPEKELYAIFITLKKNYHLLRDAKFTLRTDHRSLTFLEKGEGKIARWKNLIQEFQFTIQHIPGVDNVVADQLSRLCSLFAISSTSDVRQFFQDDYKIPSDLYSEIRSVHNSLVGHFGVDYTVKRLLAKGIRSTYLREYVKRFCRQCSTCQKLRESFSSTVTTPYTLATYHPMQRVNIDTIGPLPASQEGYKYILTIIDTCSRWVELYPLQSVDALHTVPALVQHIGRFGPPSSISSDQGSQFVNTIIESLFKMFVIEHELSLAYSHEENGIVERANKEDLRHLRALVNDSRLVSQWPLYLPFVMRIINSKVHSSTGYAPVRLLFGNNLELMPEILLDIPEDDEPTSLHDYLKNLVNVQRTILNVGMQNQLVRDTEHMQSAEPPTEYPVDSYVLLRPPLGERLSSQPKLSYRLTGPYQVLSSDQASYHILDLVTFQSKTVHISRLQPFHYDPDRTDPRQIANLDREAWDVEKIHQHRGHFKRVSSLFFLVEYSGFPDSADFSWLPWSELRTNEKLHVYLKSINKSHLIPSQFR